MIIDASVAVKWIIPEDDSAAALALLGDKHAAPTFIVTEIGNALWKKVRKNELSGDASYDEQLGSLHDLLSLAPDSPFVPRALAMACSLDHAIYDCLYLAMAEQSDLQLLTADLKFARKVEASPWARLLLTL